MKTPDPSTLELTIKPVGVVRSAIKTPMPRPPADESERKTWLARVKAEQRKINTLVTDLVIDPQFSGILDGIEEFSHVLVLFWPHLVPTERRRLLKVRPMGRTDMPEKGIFATCSPARPNPVLVSTVRLLGRDGNVLHVQGLEAVDGSPIVDIKPYVADYYSAKDPVVPSWMKQINREFRDEPIADDASLCGKEVMESEDFKRCAAFHGHICPGLSIGYRATKAAMDWLSQTRAEDEELVAIVETDACSADAVQVLTGCTFGKGNFIYKDHGKMVLTLLCRKSGKGVRVSMKPGVFAPDERHMALLQKVMQNTANDLERQSFNELHQQRSRKILAMPARDLFSIEAAEMVFPPKARIEPSEPCARCGEPTMRTKLEPSENEKICRDCLAKCAV
jgi:formylmethanofuran dehydrogenase subunit E